MAFTGSQTTDCIPKMDVDVTFLLHHAAFYLEQVGVFDVDSSSGPTHSKRPAVTSQHTMCVILMLYRRYVEVYVLFKRLTVV